MHHLGDRVRMTVAANLLLARSEVGHRHVVDGDRSIRLQDSVDIDRGIDREGETRVGGVRLENMLVVTKNGAEIMDYFPREEILVAPRGSV